jgi:hypothetical protein
MPDPSGTYYSFGLLQSAEINNVSATAPISALTLLYNEEASFELQQTVYLYLAYAGPNGTVTSGIPTDALCIELSSSTPTASVAFNDDTNAFYFDD